MVNPRLMCRKHLLGEHVELHMFVGCLLRKKTLTGFFQKGLLEVHSIRSRHQSLVKEIRRRGMQHNSPLQKFRSYKMGKINRKQSKQELASRCRDCCELINNPNASGIGRAFDACPSQ
jgi:ribosomal protein L44E